MERAESESRPAAGAWLASSSLHLGLLVCIAGAAPDVLHPGGPAAGPRLEVSVVRFARDPGPGDAFAAVVPEQPVSAPPQPPAEPARLWLPGLTASSAAPLAAATPSAALPEFGARAARPALPQAASGAPPAGAAASDALDPEPLEQPDPIYPGPARRSGREGWVELAFTIDAQGATRDVQVVDADPDGIFESAAALAIARWRYRPAQLAGSAVERRENRVRIEFRIDRIRGIRAR